jgi:hypothetical protein
MGQRMNGNSRESTSSSNYELEDHASSESGRTNRPALNGDEEKAIGLDGAECSPRKGSIAAQAFARPTKSEKHQVPPVSGRWRRLHMLRRRTRQQPTEQIQARSRDRTTLPGDLGWRCRPGKSTQHVEAKALDYCIDMQCQFTLRVSGWP